METTMEKDWKIWNVRPIILTNRETGFSLTRRVFTVNLTKEEILTLRKRIHQETLHLNRQDHKPQKLYQSSINFNRWSY